MKFPQNFQINLKLRLLLNSNFCVIFVVFYRANCMRLSARIAGGTKAQESDLRGIVRTFTHHFYYIHCQSKESTENPEISTKNVENNVFAMFFFSSIFKVSLQTKNSSHFCGGTLVRVGNESRIVTAAHCLFEPDSEVRVPHEMVSFILIRVKLMRLIVIE